MNREEFKKLKWLNFTWSIFQLLEQLNEESLLDVKEFVNILLIDKDTALTKDNIE
jgi:hypothetical protein